MTSEDTKKGSTSGCDGCALTDRRSFLVTTARLIAAALAGIGLDSERAAALPVHSVIPLRSGEADSVYPIPATDGVTIDRDNDVIVVRYQGKVFAFSLACPHQNTALRWLQADNRFQCPKHKSKYAPDGTFLSGRATRSMDRFALRKDGTNIVVDTNRMLQQDKNAKEWEAAWVTV
jgi:nitrite reductase/ring-hydroxylating ferredoxin subunit